MLSVPTVRFYSPFYSYQRSNLIWFEGWFGFGFSERALQRKSTRRLANAYKVFQSDLGVSLLRTIHPSPWNFVRFLVHPSQVTIYVIVSIFFSFILLIVKSYDLSFSAIW